MDGYSIACTAIGIYCNVTVCRIVGVWRHGEGGAGGVSVYFIFFSFSTIEGVYYFAGVVSGAGGVAVGGTVCYAGFWSTIWVCIVRGGDLHGDTSCDFSI